MRADILYECVRLVWEAKEHDYEHMKTLLGQTFYKKQEGSANKMFYFC